MLIVDGFDGSSDSTSSRAQGVSENVGVHILGKASGRNSLVLIRTDRAVTIAGPRTRLSALRFLLAGGEGGGRISVTLNYQGGRTETRRLPFPDWVADPKPPIGDDDPCVADGLVATAILNGMDRIYRGEFHDADDAALFEVVVPLQAEAVLESLVIEPRESIFENRSTRFHLLALTGVAPAPD